MWLQCSLEHNIIGVTCSNDCIKPALLYRKTHTQSWLPAVQNIILSECYIAQSNEASEDLRKKIKKKKKNIVEAHEWEQYLQAHRLFTHERNLALLPLSLGVHYKAQQKCKSANKWQKKAEVIWRICRDTLDDVCTHIKITHAQYIQFKHK